VQCTLSVSAPIVRIRHVPSAQWSRCQHNLCQVVSRLQATRVHERTWVIDGHAVLVLLEQFGNDAIRGLRAIVRMLCQQPQIILSTFVSAVLVESALPIVQVECERFPLSHRSIVLAFQWQVYGLWLHCEPCWWQPRRWLWDDANFANCRHAPFALMAPCRPRTPPHRMQSGHHTVAYS
jgi:hypothetical protein